MSWLVNMLEDKVRKWRMKRLERAYRRMEAGGERGQGGKTIGTSGMKEQMEEKDFKDVWQEQAEEEDRGLEGMSYRTGTKGLVYTFKDSEWKWCESGSN